MKHLLILFFGITLTAQAQQLTNRYITIHQQGGASVQDVLSFALQKGANTLTYQDLLPGLNPQTLFVFDEVSPVQTEFLHASQTGDLVKQYVGETISVSLEGGERFTGILRETAFGGYLLEQADQSVVFISFQQARAIQFPSLKTNYKTDPQLFMMLQSDKKRTSTIWVGYQTGALQWQPSYKIIMDDEEKNVRFQSVASVQNNLDKPLNDISLRFSYGNLDNRVQARPSPRRYEAAKMEMMASDAYVNSPISEEVGDAYEWVFPGTVSIAPKSMRQFVLMDVKQVPLKKWYAYQSYGSNREKVNPETHISFQLSEKNGFSSPLAAGMADIIMHQKDEFKPISKVSMKNSAVNEVVELNLGSAMDIWISESVTENNPVNKNTTLNRYKLEIKNNKKESVRVKVSRDLDSYTSITESSIKYEIKNAYQAEFWVEIGAGKSVSFSYSTRTEYR